MNSFAPPKARRATFIGFSAICMWSLLALLTVSSGTVPPFQLAALTFAVGGVLGLVWIVQARAWSVLHQPVQVWALGIGGLFGYHALYFTALRLAPPAEAGLICYLWPLLIVIFSGLLPGERLHLNSIFGAFLGFAGTVVLFIGQGIAPALDHAGGYVAAFCAAFTWAGYSVLSRRFAAVPSAAVAGFCIGTAVLACFCHFAFEKTVWPQNVTEWLAIIALGVGPVGAAFYTWDVGVKHGNIRLLGVVSYMAPIMSTSFLVHAQLAKPSAELALSALLIAGGGLLATRDIFKK